MAVDLTTRTTRRRLSLRHRPYWQRIARGRALGYRRARGGDAGAWYVRVRTAKAEGDPYRWKVIGTADDLPHVEADGDEVLSYAQAVDRAGSWDPAEEDAKGGDVEHDTLTVRDVVERYLAWADEHRGRSACEARYAMRAHVLPALGDVQVEDLSADRLSKWLAAVAKKPARTRSPKGQQRHRQAKTEDEKRARRASANRVFSVLKAALNRAWRDGVIKGDPVWRRVEAFRGVERSRARYLEANEIRRLLNGCTEPSFRALVAGAIYTGARYQELARLRVEDVNLDAASVLIRQSKTDRPRAVFLNEEGRALFEQLTAGRPADALVFTRGGSAAWGKSEQQQRMRDVCEAAKIEPRITFHGLRHTYASLYLMAGGGLTDLAKQLGHSTTRMVERHYGHLADKWRAERARQFAPALGIKPNRKVRRLKKASTQ